MTEPLTRYEECPACAAKPGAPLLCAQCLERRTLYAERDELLKALRILFRGYVKTPDESGDETWSARNTEACRVHVVAVLDKFVGIPWA